MKDVWSFLLKFFTVFVKGLSSIFVTGKDSETTGGLFGGIAAMFNYNSYKAVIDEWVSTCNPGTGDWVIAIIGIALVCIVLIGLIVLLIVAIKKFITRIFSKETNQDLVSEIAHLRAQLKKTNKDKERILKMRLQGKEGLISTDAINESDGGGASLGGAIHGGHISVDIMDKEVDKSESRFYKLTEVDRYYNDPSYVPPVYDNTITLPEICSRFRNYACSEMRLFYEIRTIRLFWASFATTRIVILQGISGTGKTSLPYATGQWLNRPATIVSVQPSWRDRTEIFGYFNEFTKRFNETETIKKMYEARYTEEVFLTVIDEANIARVEYYFAELLSILEMPSRDNWIVDLVPSGWDSDPKFVVKGRFKLPENMWYICTINNDDSTFAISDKVYDRAMPININSKGVAFDVPEEERNPNKLILSYKHLENLYHEAQEKYVVSAENIKKFDDMDNYVIEHFRLAFGNRIVKQLKEFVPAYVGCGGTEIDGLDYVLCNKILRKFESLNLAYIRNEIDGYIQYLSDHFGPENMQESKEYLNRLKKLF